MKDYLEQFQLDDKINLLFDIASLKLLIEMNEQKNNKDNFNKLSLRIFDSFEDLQQLLVYAMEFQLELHDKMESLNFKLNQLQHTDKTEQYNLYKSL